jgi:probable phosphoglycerate mutase
MTLLALIRHADTDWNRRGLIQGSSDIALDAEGRAEASAWTLPRELDGFEWIASPLKRAYETATILCGRAPPTDPRLVEMAWGTWEGRTIPDLRAELGNLMTAWEVKGLDFQAPEGESPRRVQERVRPLLSEIAARGRPTAAVCHRGVMRAIYAFATGWDMTSKSPEKLLEPCAHIFALDAQGRPSVHKLNLPLRPQ